MNSGFETLFLHSRSQKEQSGSERNKRQAQTEEGKNGGLAWLRKAVLIKVDDVFLNMHCTLLGSVGIGKLFFSFAIASSEFVGWDGFGWLKTAWRFEGRFPGGESKEQ
jgi:hypothetical protein